MQPVHEEKSVDLEILTVAVRPRIGGMTSWIEQIAAGLSNQGWKIRLVGFTDRLDREGHEGYEVLHIPTSRVGRLPLQSLDKYSRWRWASKIYRRWRMENADPRLLLVDGTPGILQVAHETAMERGIPWTILTGGNVFAETEGGFLSSYLQRSVRESMNAATRILVDGADLVEALVSRGIARELLRVQPHGVDLSRFASRAGESRYFAGEGPTPRIKLAWHGRLANHHGPLRFVEIARAIEGARARLCGAGEDVENLKKTLSEIGGSNWWVGLLPSEELGRFLGEAQVGVYPLEDMAGIPTVLLESMAAGLPTLSYPVGAASDLIRQGENGFLLRDKKAMIDTIDAVANNETLRRSIGENARKTIEKDWSVEATSKLLMENLEELSNS